MSEEIHLPETAGTYNVTLADGTELSAWFNPSSAHWIADGVEVGFADRIKPVGSKMEQRIVLITA